MKEKIYIPGPARVMYGAYLGLLAVVVYSGFNYLHPFSSGWRYPWTNALLRLLNFYVIWAIALVAFVYLYYATLGRPKKWNEPLGIFRIVIGLYTIWFFFVSYAVSQPFGWLKGLTDAFGGPAGLFKAYELFLWLLILVNVIYVYARWVKSERFPRLRARETEELEGGDK